MRENSSRVALRQCECSNCVDGDGLARHRADQAGADFDVAVIVHQAGGVHLHGGAMRLVVDEQAAALGAQCERLGQRQWPVAVLAQDPVAAGFGAGRGIGADDAALGDVEAFGDQGLDADVVGAGG